MTWAWVSFEHPDSCPYPTGEPMQQDLLGELSPPATNSTTESATAIPPASGTVNARKEDLGQTDPASGYEPQPAEAASEVTEPADPAPAE